MADNRQEKAPIFEALKKLKIERIVHFDVPGHKTGKGNPDLTYFLGEKCLINDINSMKPVDNLVHPTSVIKEAEILAAEAFGAASAFLMVNGTTSAVQGMIMSTVKAGEKIIMPRNVHRSAINALVVNGAIPIYVNPGVSKKLGIPLGMSMENITKAINENPDAKAVFVNNPTYYGICSNLKAIVELAHKHNMKVLVDEAHGTHFSFGENMPISAMHAGADMSALSMHKTGGSLTQSSFLLCGKNVNTSYVRQVVNLTQTTSGSYLLMVSLDLARRDLSLRGKELFQKTVDRVSYARKEINRLGGYYAFGDDIVNGDDIFTLDPTKLSVHCKDIGLAGIEIFDILRDDYDIQIEFGDMANFLAIISAADSMLEIESLISALSEIKRTLSLDPKGMIEHEYINPKVVLSPNKAFYSNKVSLPIEKSAGRICGEFCMCYPPGIPIIAPGEVITNEVIEYIAYAKEKGSLMTGTQDMNIENIFVVQD